MALVHDNGQEFCAALGWILVETRGEPPLAQQMPFIRRGYGAEDKKRAREDPRGASTWVRDRNGRRRTLTGGSEICTDLDHGRNPRTGEAQLQNTAYFGTPDQMSEGLRS